MVKTYDPQQVSLVVGGTIIKSWNKISVARDEDTWFFSTGTSGESTRTKNANLLGSITVTLPQASEDNAALSAYEFSGALLSCMLRDASGQSLYAMADGTVLKPADSEFNKEAGEREWVIRGNLEQMTVGGN